MRVIRDRLYEIVWVHLCKWRIQQLDAMIHNHMDMADDPWYDTAGHRSFANEAGRFKQMLLEEIV